MATGGHNLQVLHRQKLRARFAAKISKIHNEIARRAVELGSSWGGCADSWAPSRRSLGAPSATWAPLLARSGLDWLALAAPGALAGSIWPRLARSGCPCCPGWLDLAALCAPGRPSWLDLAANDYPIDTISKKKTICLSTILLRCCLLRALWNVSSCLKSSTINNKRYGNSAVDSAA